MHSKFAGGIYIKGMRSSTLRWIILLASFLIALMTGVQLFWLNKIYSFEHKTFNTNVVKSIRGLYEDLPIADTPANHLQDLIEHPAPDYFLFRVDIDHLHYDSLVYYLKHELNDFDVLTDAHIGLYDSRSQQSMLDEQYIPAAAARYDPSHTVLPNYHRNIRLCSIVFSAPQ